MSHYLKCNIYGLLHIFPEASTNTVNGEIKPMKKVPQKSVVWEDQKERVSIETLSILTESLVGLSDINLKRGRTHRHSASEWFQFNLCAIAYMKEGIYLCEKNEDLDEPGWKDMDVVNMRLKIEQRLKGVQDNFGKHIKGHFVDESNKCIHQKWLEELVQFFKDSLCIKIKPDVKEKKSETNHECSLSRDNSMKRKQPEKRERTMDLNKIQKAITKLVRNITRDIRSRYRRKKLSEETMRRSVSCEIISLMSPITDDDQLVTLFEQVIAEEEEEVLETASLALDIETSTKLQNGCTSKSGHNSRNNSPRHTPKHRRSDSGNGKKTELNVQLCTVEGPNTASGKSGVSGITMQLTPSGSPVHKPSQASTSVRIEDSNGNHAEIQVQEESILRTPPCNLPGVLTLWKGYRTARPNSLPFKKYKLLGYEEISPLTETSTSIFTDNEMKASPLQQITVHPITVSKLFETFAQMLILVAESYREEEKYSDLSVELYKYALGLIYQCPRSNRTGGLIASALKTLGIIKSCKGDIVAGCQLLDESMEVYRSIEIKDKFLHISEVWLELGKAYLMEKDHVTSLFGHVMSEVRSELDSEFKPESFDIPIPEESDDSDSSQGESYSLHVFEAIDCLDSALNELQKLNLDEDEIKRMLIAILTKLADCHMVTGNYDKAINFYEDAMTHCRCVSGSEAMENNAHLLSMLGVCNFLLGNYPKAATMLETASILEQHIYGLTSNFGLVFTLTMLGLTYYKMRQYHKCIIWCLKSNDLNQLLYDKPISSIIGTIHFNRAWFIIQNLFTLGYAYYTLDFNDRAIKYLEKAKELIEHSQESDIKQNVKLLKVIADTYINLDCHENALEIYEKALAIAASVGDEKSSVALQNQLLNCMAGVQVHVREYAGAAEYLEQALCHQKNVESNIKGDLIGLQYRLGHTYTMSGDIDKAIDCFEECLETLNEMPGTPGKERVNTLGKLASLYYVKGLMQEDNDYMYELLVQANNYFTKATTIDVYSFWNVHYANFLMQQNQPADALEQMLPLLYTKPFRTDKELSFSGLVQAILPEHLQHESDDIDDYVVETKVFAYFIAILCFKDLDLVKDADDCLVEMYKIVLSSKKYSNYALMGYAFTEMNMYLEAAECFAIASQIPCYNVHLPTMNACLCYCVHIYQLIINTLMHIMRFISVQKAQSNAAISASGKENTQSVVVVSKTFSAIPAIVNEEQRYERGSVNRDSGYFENIVVPDLENDHVTNSVLEFSLNSLDSSKSSSSKSDASTHSQNTSSSVQYESDSSFLTDQSMMSDDSAGYTSGESGRERADSLLGKLDSSSLAYEEEVWETVDESGNVISRKVVKSNIASSTIYEVENNGNYQQSNLEEEHNNTVDSLSSAPTTDSNKAVCNANYQSSMSEDVKMQFNETWSSKSSSKSTSITEKKLDNITSEVSTTYTYDSNSNQSSPKRKLPESRYTYPSKYQNKSIYNSSYIEPTTGGLQSRSGTDSDSEEEVWQTFDTETVDTPSEILNALLKSQGKV